MIVGVVARGATVSSQDDATALKAWIAANPSYTTDEAIFEAINAPTAVADPAWQATVPVPLTPAALLGLLTQASAANVETFPGIVQLFQDIQAQNRANVGSAVALMAAAGRITPTEAANMTTALSATEANPTPQGTVSTGPSWAQTNLGALGAKQWPVDARPEGATSDHPTVYWISTVRAG